VLDGHELFGNLGIVVSFIILVGLDIVVFLVHFSSRVGVGRVSLVVAEHVVFPLQELSSRTATVFRGVTILSSRVADTGEQCRSHVVQMIYVEETDFFQSEFFPLIALQSTGLIKAVEEALSIRTGRLTTGGIDCFSMIAVN
jgi:hypothetical protein